MSGSTTTALVSWAGAAEGSRAAAAALACAGSDVDRAGLLIELSDERAPRPGPLATEAARRLEARLAAHLPEYAVAARGRLCHIVLPAGPSGLELLPSALPLARDSIGVVHLPPELVQTALDLDRVAAGSILLRADLVRDRALTALAVRALIGDGLRVAVLKRSLSWLASRAALLGVLPPDAASGLPSGLLRRLLSRGTGYREEFLLSEESAGARPAGGSDRAEVRWEPESGSESVPLPSLLPRLRARSRRP